MLFNAMLVFVGGGLGAVSRYLVTTFMGNHVGGSFPYGTFAANIIGSFCMGAVMFYFLNKSMPVPEHIRLLLLVGFMGGLYHLFLIQYGNSQPDAESACAVLYAERGGQCQPGHRGGADGHVCCQLAELTAGDSYGQPGFWRFGSSG